MIRLTRIRKVDDTPCIVEIDYLPDRFKFLLSKDLNINIFDAIEQKMAKNAAKYPVNKCFGKATKYNKL